MISFIIPNRGGKNIKFVSDRLRELYKDCEIIVVTQDDEAPFARGQLFNIGYRYATNEYMCFIDNDMFFPKYIDLEGLYKKKKCMALQPFETIIQVEITGENTYTKKSSAKKIPMAKGGATFISKENFRKANGMSNLYIGWGREDNEFDKRVKGIADIKENICHIEHPRRLQLNRKNSLLNMEYYDTTDKRDASKDGYNDTLYDLVSNTVNDGIRYVNVKNVRVSEGFPYKELFDKHFSKKSMKNLDFHDMLLKEIGKHVASKYVLIGVPKHMNLGDTLIWEAEVQILDKTKAKRLYTYFFGTENINIDDNTIIVWSGGGYFSDIWPNTIEYIKKMLLKYKNNKHVFLPNSVFFSKEETVKEINAAIRQCKKSIVVFSREQQSMQEAKKLNGITSILLPDVVLGWNIDKYMEEHRLSNSNGENTLYISRNDREKIGNQNIKADKVSDWPTMSSRPSYIKDCNAHDWSFDIRKRLVNDAINFIVPYKKVYSDRMHGAILSWLLGKETILIDNSYHKSSSLYNTWLKDEETIKMLQK